jgi:RimJ/RimL family protein N-acetyltransferase
MRNSVNQAKANRVELRDVIEQDLPLFFEHQLDEDANRMAAFTAEDPSNQDAFMARWIKILSNEAITKKTILFEGEVVGNLGSFEMFGEPHVAYWIAKPYWGQGIATQALAEFLTHVKPLLLYARVAKDNIGSVRVLQKCGFVIAGEDKGFSNARGAEVEEYILMLR